MNNRVFGTVMVLLGAALLWFVVSGALTAAPLLLVFGTLGGIGAVILGIWGVIGRY